MHKLSTRLPDPTSHPLSNRSGVFSLGPTSPLVLAGDYGAIAFRWAAPYLDLLPLRPILSPYFLLLLALSLRVVSSQGIAPVALEPSSFVGVGHPQVGNRMKDCPQAACW